MSYSLHQCQARLEEIDRALMDPSVMSNVKRLKSPTKARAHIEPMVLLWQELERCREELADAKEMLSDPEMREMAEMEIDDITPKIPVLEEKLRVAMLPPDPYEGRDIILEVRAGTGGDEAALFAYDLYRMYSRFCEGNRWRIEVLSSNIIHVGGGSGKTSIGYKEVICQISGADAYRFLRHESGVHRVQRIPLTESQGRIHTSASTVAIMPVAEAVDVEINNNDLRIDTYRSSGAGGQHVNTTDSAIRITHIPTGIVVTCQDEKSQHKNKAKAMKVLASRLLQAKEEEAHKEMSEARRSQVGSGDRSEQIRTYNYPQNRITDHRINLTLYKLDRFMEGDVLDMIDALNAHLQEQQIAELGTNI